MNSCFFMKYLLVHTVQIVPIPQTIAHGDAWRFLSLFHSTALIPPLPINLFLTTLLYSTMCSTDTHFTLPHVPNHWPSWPVTIFRYTPSMLSTHLFTHQLPAVCCNKHAHIRGIWGSDSSVGEDASLLERYAMSNDKYRRFEGLCCLHRQGQAV